MVPKNKVKLEYDFYKLLPRCEVCGVNHSVTMTASSLADCKVSYCETCLLNNAEPEWIFEYFHSQENATEFLESLNTFIDGEYVSWYQWCTS